MRILSYIAVLLSVVLFPHNVNAYSNSVIDAFKQAEQGQYFALENLHKNANDPVVKSAAEWVLLREQKPNFYKIVTFVEQHPNWPFIDGLKTKAEEVIDFQIMERDAYRWFQKHKPETYNGVTYYLKILKKNNNTSKAKAIARDFWTNEPMTRDQQREFYSKNNSYFTQSDHQKRIRLLFTHDRYEQAQAVANLLGNEYASFINASIKLARNENGVSSAISNVSAKYASHPDLLYERLKWRRKNDMNAGAIEILNKAPPASKMHSPKDWWRERHIIIRRLLDEKKYQKAYQLASAHKQKEGFALAQAEFLAGWLALRFINKPYQAFEHFEKLYKNVETPISKSRGAYWAGRASEALGDKTVANQWYAVAAQYNETFYGQLAAQKTPANEIIKIKTAPSVSNQVYRNDVRVKVAELLHEAGLKKESRLFLFRLMRDRQGHEDLISLAQLSRALGHDDISIKAAQEIQKKYNKTYHDYLYPRRLKAVRNIRNVEWALVHAIIRQESRFDEGAISPAGARGLMQLMPATAKETARQNGLRHNTAWLTTNAQHNITLGSKYIAKLVRQFSGNYAMAAAGYNAGPNRVDRWSRDNGNPQNAQIDLIDWIELIPIYETRNYVQRVLEATYVYRHYLSGIQQTPLNEIHLVAK
jgi:soluble lytic murein transglycosylase